MRTPPQTVQPHPADGFLSILNVGAGDLRISFNPKYPAEAKRAREMVTDMLRRGYAIVVAEEDGTHSPVNAFDPETCEYIVADSAPVGAEEEAAAAPPTPRKRGRPRTRRIPARKARATAIAPSAGG
jgi:hypothetical protein